MSFASRSSNWDTVAEELDKVGLIIEDDALSDIKDAKQVAIDRLFTRIERYSTIIAGPDFLKFENVDVREFVELLAEDLEHHNDSNPRIDLKQHTASSWTSFDLLNN